MRRSGQIGPAEVMPALSHGWWKVGGVRSLSPLTSATEAVNSTSYRSVAEYQPPPLLAERAGNTPLRWRVRAEDATGREVARSGWRRLTLAPP
jgi:hypothetical protein